MGRFCLAATRMLLLMLIAAGAAAEQPYPSKPIRFVTAYAAGGSTTVVARLVGQKLTESWGQPVLVDNRPGGNTMVGHEAVAKSAPDGYTIMLSGSNLVLVPLLLKAPYDPIRDFAPVATIDKFEFMLLVHPSVPVRNLKEFIAYAKARPGQLNYATPGAGGGQHLVHEQLNMIAGIKTQHVPYKGAVQALTDLMGGQVQLYFSNVITAVPHVKTGKLKALATTGDRRIAALPDVPTFGEAGLDGFSKAGGFQCILAPAGTPKAIVNKLSAEVAKFLAQPEFQEKLTALGLEPFVSTPEQLVALLKEGLETNAKIIKSANIQFEN